MAPLLMKYVVSYSSQDPKHPADSLLNGDCWKSWLCAPDDRSGTLEAEFQLQRSCVISFLDIGNCGSAFIQVSVGRSVGASKEYVTLLPAASFMTPIESKMGQNKKKIRMFTEENFDAATRSQHWDRIKVVCMQPFKKDKQFGISFLKIRSANVDNTTNQDQESDVPIKSPETGANRHAASIKFATPSWKSSSQIHKHFFGKDKKQDEDGDALKARLVKMNASCENGTDQPTSLSRSAQMLLTVAANSPKYAVRNSPTATSSGPSSDRKRKRPQSFDVEVKEFLNGLDMSEIDMDTVTFADLRHRLEKQKVRKLSKEEKKTFLAVCQEFMDTFISNQGTEDLKEAQIETGAWRFFSSLNLATVDFQKTTFTDLRKDWEIQKGSKLSKEEKKIFLKIGQDFLTKWYDQQENTDEQQTNPAKQAEQERTNSAAASKKSAFKFKKILQENHLKKNTPANRKIPPTNLQGGRNIVSGRPDIDSTTPKRSRNSNGQSFSPVNRTSQAKTSERKGSSPLLKNNTGDHRSSSTTTWQKSPSLNRGNQSSNTSNTRTPNNQNGAHKKRKFASPTAQETSDSFYGSVSSDYLETRVPSQSSGYGSQPMGDEDDDEIQVQCPLCQQMFPTTVINLHANHCADVMSGGSSDTLSGGFLRPVVL